MTSARSLNLELNESPSIQLGAVTQVRGLNDIDGVLFPRFTGAYLEDPSLNQILTPGEILLPRRPDSKSFLSSDIDFPDLQTLVFPSRVIQFDQVILCDGLRDLSIQNAGTNNIRILGSKVFAPNIGATSAPCRDRAYPPWGMRIRFAFDHHRPVGRVK